MVHTVFVICFGVGAGFVVLSFIFGEALGLLGIGGDASADASGFDGVDSAGDPGDFGDFGDFDAGGFENSADAGGFHADVSGAGGEWGDAPGFDARALTHKVSPFKPMVIATFLTVFGGTGLLFDSRMLWMFALAGAAFCGLAVAFALLRFVYVPLYKYQGRGVVEKQRLVGMSATVTEGIPQGGFGKIKYVVEDNAFTAPAKAEDGGIIPRGSAVQIMYIEKNAFFVKIKN